MIEERLRFQKASGGGNDDDGTVFPVGPRTLIVREGTADDEITPELFRMDVNESDDSSSSSDGGKGTHSGPRVFDTAIASILYLAS